MKDTPERQAERTLRMGKSKVLGPLDNFPTPIFSACIIEHLVLHTNTRIHNYTRIPQPKMVISTNTRE